MRTVDLIRHKRDGGALDRRQIAYLVAGVTDGRIPDYQAAALLMAVVLRGMTVEETVDLTAAMVDSGVRLSFDGRRTRPVDKHSTGGVGDKTSLVIAPLVAASGGVVPMMSGRGLGHTGGTLDKLESIPGFRTSLALDEIRAAVDAVGAALVGQTDDIAPADRRLYALRDVTGTVESIPLITASILSKKIAEGIGALVLDVKAGSGAFMKSRADARRLADALVTIGTRFGLATEALVTGMDDPLGAAVGHANEVIESIETLKGRGPRDVESLSIALAARMLVLAGVTSDEREADERLRRALASGAGLEVFGRIIAQQGGDARVLDDYGRLPLAPGEHHVPAPRAGFITGIDAWRIGQAVVALGGGRSTLDDAIDHGVGIQVAIPPGAQVASGETVLIVRHRGGRGLAEALPLAGGAIRVGDAAPGRRALVLDTVRAATRETTA
jgi:pyrimidine-nucleoside phosphorylase